MRGDSIAQGVLNNIYIYIYMTLIRSSPISRICYDNRMLTLVKVRAHNNLKAHLKLLCVLMGS